jgi:hypothetical protein
MHRSFAIRSVLIVTALAVLMIALASSTPSKAATPSANLAAAFQNCTPIGIGVFENRVHVRCSAGIGGGPVIYFAVCSTGSNSALASRMLSTFTTAFATNNQLDLFYNTGDTTGTACGCGTSDCIRIWGAEVR